MAEEANGWREYQKLVLAELQRCDNRLTEIDRRLTKIERDIAVLQTKMYVGSAVVASVASGIVALVVSLLQG